MDKKNKNVLLCVGNDLMGDDGAGPMLAKLCEDNPVEGWTVLDGGAAPENDIGYIRELKPEHLLIVDATDMGVPFGEARVIDEKDIAEMFIATTHNMPLTFLINQLREDVPNVTFIGIQPEVIGFMYPMGEVIKKAVTTMYERLSSWDWSTNGGYEKLIVERDEDEEEA